MSQVNLKKALADILPAVDLAKLVRGYDVVGDIAIIVVPESLHQYEAQISRAIISSRPKIRLVAKRVGNYFGETRLIELEKIGGEGGLITVHKEFGVTLHVNPSKVYFSPRSSTERYRIAGLVEPNEEVLVMFSGIAPLPLIISRHSKARRVVGVELNPEAHRLALQNLTANQRTKNVLLYQGDVSEVLPSMNMKFCRLAMPLPSEGRRYIAIASQVLQEGGWIHFYDFQKKKEFEKTVETLGEEFLRYGRKIVSVSIHKCGHISPGKYRICVDAKVL